MPVIDKPSFVLSLRGDDKNTLISTRVNQGLISSARRLFVLCPFQIIGPAVAVNLNALDFTICYDLTKVHFNSADCLNT